MSNSLLQPKSFLMGGYECADHINRSGERINLQIETEHDVRVFQDYKDLQTLGIHTVREGICWSAVEIKPYQFDFSRLDPFFEAAKALNMQIIWDMCHFGYPDDLIPTHPQFAQRFSALCRAFVEYHRKHTEAEPWIVPINEISFLAWHSGDVRGTVPFAINSGSDIKYHLCQAAIAGIKAIKEIAPKSVIMLVEPLIRIHQHYAESDPLEIAEKNKSQFQAMEIILGMESPELEGNPDLVDMLGFNYYYNNQWNEKMETIHWLEEPHLMIPLNQLLLEVSHKFKKSMLLTETGHFGPGRDVWMGQVTAECIKAIDKGVDLRGICIYPVIDRPDWDDLTSYCQCGIWNLDAQNNRIPEPSYFNEVLKSQVLFNKMVGLDTPGALKML